MLSRRTLLKRLGVSLALAPTLNLEDALAELSKPERTYIFPPKSGWMTLGPESVGKRWVHSETGNLYIGLWSDKEKMIQGVVVDGEQFFSPAFEGTLENRQPLVFGSSGDWNKGKSITATALCIQDRQGNNLALIPLTKEIDLLDGDHVEFSPGAIDISIDGPHPILTDSILDGFRKHRG